MDNIESLINRPLITLPDPAERKRLRVLFKVTQLQLANSLGITRKTVAKWETGDWEPTGRNRDNYASVLSAWAATEKETQRKETQS
jgi:DNA-binding XRE family transcriptional regulator